MQSAERASRVLRARVAVTATFAAHALAAGTLGPWIPRLKADTGLEASELGLALMVYAVGLAAGTRLAGPIMRRLGGRITVRLGVPMLGAGLAALPLANGLPTLAVVFAVFGAASGVLDVAMNTEAVAVEERYGRHVMSTMHATWSVGVLVGAAVASLGVAARVPFGAHMVGVAVVLVAASASVLRWLPAPHEPRRAAEGSAEPEPAWTGRIALLCLIAFASFLAEGVAADWSAVYLREGVETSARIAGLGVVAFSAGMTLSRFAGDRLSMRFDPSMLVRTGAAAGGFALAVSLATQSATVSIVALALLGLGLGPVIPLAFRSAGLVRRSRGRTALDLALTSGYVGSIVGPVAVGFLADAVGWQAAFAIPVLMCAAASLSSRAIREPRR